MMYNSVVKKKLEHSYDCHAKYHCVSPCLLCQVIVGFGGLGKTSLSFRYADCYRERYPGGVFYFDLGSLSTFHNSVKDNVSFMAIYINMLTTAVRVNGVCALVSACCLGTYCS